MIISLTLLLAAISVCAALVLSRTWAIERMGVDMETEKMEIQDMNRFSARQKLALALLAAPAGAILFVALLYVLATIVVSLLGIH